MIVLLLLHHFLVNDVSLKVKGLSNGQAIT